MNVLRVRCLSVVWVGLIASSTLSAQEPKLRDTLKGHTDGATPVTFSPDGKRLASGSFDRTVKLWDVATGKEQATLKGHTSGVYSVVYSPDGKMCRLGVSSSAGASAISRSSSRRQ